MIEGNRTRLLASLALALAGAAVYANSLQGPFIFDDHISIIESSHVRRLWPISEALSASPGSVASGRPLVAFSLALNYAWGGLEVLGYHALNVAAHVATALAFFGLLRRALLRTASRDTALGTAFLGALLWTVHPLNTDALNQVVSRCEVFAAGFYLSTAYAAERSFEGRPRGRWQALAVLSCAAAMASKEVAVSAPLFVLLYDRTLVVGSFRGALSERKGFYAALAATWVVLGLAIASGDRGVSVGFDQALSTWDYLRTQAQGLLHYLRLAFWPSNLAIDYSGWPVVREWSAAVAPGLVVLTLLGATFGLLLRRSAAALPALLFFAVLAPSSSFIPLTGERLAEHRMYLPLAALVALCVPGVLTFSQRRWPARGRVVAAALLLASAAPLAWATVRRNADYRSELGIWEDTLRKYPENARAQDYIASLLLAQGRYAEALPHAEEALRLDPELSTVDSNLATILMQLGERERAVHHFRRAERYCSGSAIFHGNFGVVLGQSGALDEALQHLRRALLLDPGYLTPRRNLGILLAGAGRTREALPHLQQVLAAQEDPELMLLVIPILAGDPDSGLRDGALALRLAQNLVALAPRDPRSHDSLGMAYAELRRFEEAVQAAERCLEGAAALGQARFEAEVRARLELYRARRPYRTQARD